MLLVEASPDWKLQWGGTMFLPLFLKAIPRTEWVDKPAGTATWFMDLFFPGWTDTGFSTAVGGVIDLFINFGVIGCFAWFFVLGMVGRIIFSWVLADRRDLLRLIIYSYSAASIFLFIRNELQIQLPIYMSFIVSMWVVSKYVRSSNNQVRPLRAATALYN
jgi:hypothetical protein